jgi:hypothetical protein
MSDTEELPYNTQCDDQEEPISLEDLSEDALEAPRSILSDYFSFYQEHMANTYLRTLLLDLRKTRFPNAPPYSADSVVRRAKKVKFQKGPATVLAKKCLPRPVGQQAVTSILKQRVAATSQHHMVKRSQYANPKSVIVQAVSMAEDEVPASTDCVPLLTGKTDAGASLYVELDIKGMKPVRLLDSGACEADQAEMDKISECSSLSGDLSMDDLELPPQLEEPQDSVSQDSFSSYYLPLDEIHQDLNHVESLLCV